MKTNCKNCGSTFFNKNRCQYCGTFIDGTLIEIKSDGLEKELKVYMWEILDKISSKKLCD